MLLDSIWLFEMENRVKMKCCWCCIPRHTAYELFIQIIRSVNFCHNEPPCVVSWGCLYKWLEIIFFCSLFLLTPVRSISSDKTIVLFLFYLQSFFSSFQLNDLVRYSFHLLQSRGWAISVLYTSLRC